MVLDEPSAAGGATAAQVWAYAARALTDKTGFALSAAERIAIQGVILSDATAFQGADVAAILTDTAAMQPRVPRITCHMDFWGDPQDNLVQITNAATSINLPNVVVADLPAGITITRVIALLKIALARDTSGSDNAVNNANMDLMVDSNAGYGSTVTAINIPDNSWHVDVSTSPDRGGDVLIGNTDVTAEVTGNATYYFRFENAQADGNNLELHDINAGLRVYFTV